MDDKTCVASTSSGLCANIATYKAPDDKYYCDIHKQPKDILLTSIAATARRNPKMALFGVVALIGVLGMLNESNKDTNEKDSDEEDKNEKK